MAKKPAVKEESLPIQIDEAITNAGPFPISFTGIARSVICYNNQNKWRNFKICTLHIKDGIVHKIDYSDPYIAAEAGGRLDLANDISLLSLNSKWKDGATLGIAKDPNIYWENKERK